MSDTMKQGSERLAKGIAHDFVPYEMHNPALMPALEAHFLNDAGLAGLVELALECSMGYGELGRKGCTALRLFAEGADGR